MITTKPDEEQKETEEDRLVQRIRETLTDLQARIGPHFRRAEVRSRAGRFLEGLLANVPRKNGWQMAEELGENGPRGVQRLLGEADWDEDAVRDELRSYVREHLGEAGGLLVMDETGFLKKGKKSAGVARQYSGTAGRRENSQIGVFLLYASSKGYAFLDRELYLPEEWTVDRVRCREAGIPDAVGFATKGELAHQMLVRAFEARVPAQWVVGDTVYGYEELRLFLEEHDKNYVLAIPETHTLWVQGEPRSVGLLAALLPQEAWTVLSAGEGSKGERLYEWAWLQLPEQEPASQGKLHWVLIRRSLSNPNERAYYRVYGPADITLAELARVAGGRWHIEEGLEQTKGEVGLDQYARARLSCLVSACDARAAGSRRSRGPTGSGQRRGKKSGAEQEYSPWSVAELRRVVHVLREPPERRTHGLRWSHFRRLHQAGAQRCHRQRRASQAPLTPLQATEALPLLGLPRLTDAQWEQIRPLLPPQKPVTGRPAVDPRLMVEGMVLVMRTGCSWRALPERFGPWQTVVSRYRRWCQEGLWARILPLLQAQEVPITSSA
jgi:SRSO17 transposase